MELKSESREYGGVRIHVQQLPPIQAYGLIPELGQIIVPLFASGLSLKDDVGKLAGPVMAALMKLSANELTSLTKRLFKGCYAVVNDSKVDLHTDSGINDAFSGKLLELFQTLYFALEVNYKDFLFGAFGLIKELKVESAEKSDEVTTAKTTERVSA